MITYELWLPRDGNEDDPYIIYEIASESLPRLGEDFVFEDANNRTEGIDASHARNFRVTKVVNNVYRALGEESYSSGKPIVIVE